MNKKSRDLGLQNTSFITPHGLDANEHYTTALELAKITDYALENKKFAQIVNTKTTSININGNNKTISNTNELLGNLNGVDGVKTGFTNNAGRCLVTSTTRNNHQIICVVLGADTKKIRTKDSTKLIEYAFSNYEYINTKDMINNEFKDWCSKNKVKINKGKNIIPNINMDEISISEVPIKKNDINSVQVQISANTNFEAPIEENTIIGKIELKLRDEVLLDTNIRIQNKIDKKDTLTYFIELLTGYTKYMQENCKLYLQN